MNKHFIGKAIAGSALALTLFVGGFGGISVARADNSSHGIGSAVSALVSGSEESKQTLIALLKQLIALLLEQRGDDSHEDADDDTDTGISELEATIYTNETVVKLELDDTKYLFTTDETKRSALVVLIAEKYDLNEEEVDDHLTIEDEDRASRASDKDWADEEDDSDDDTNDREDVREEIADLEDDLDDLEEDIDDADESGDVADGDISDAEDLLDDARALVDDAGDAFHDERYDDAMDLLHEAEDLMEDIEDLIDEHDDDDDDEDEDEDEDEDDEDEDDD